jgi:Fe-S-cluster containining protein
VHDTLAGSSLGERLIALDAVYASIEASQSAFRATAIASGSPLACPPGCSTCCKGFVPDVLPVEADRIALFLLRERRDLLELFLALKESSESPVPTCVFWNPLNPEGGCSIYPARALICRFFGFSAMKDKEGEPAFTLCRWMPAPPDVPTRILVGQALLEKLFGALPPPMTDLSFAAAAIDPDAAGTRLPLHEALDSALSRVSLTLKMAAAEADARP